MDEFGRRTVTSTPNGETVMVSTVVNAIARETAVFPCGAGGGIVTVEVRLQERLGLGADPDVEHERIVRGIADGTIDASQPHVPADEEIQEAIAFFSLLGVMEDLLDYADDYMDEEADLDVDSEFPLWANAPLVPELLQ